MSADKTGGHAPGPWHVSQDGGDVYDDLGYTVCEFYAQPDTDEAKANTRLIAESPAMFHELKHLADLLDAHFEQGGSIPGIATTNKARQIIARATGN